MSVNEFVSVIKSIRKLSSTPSSDFYKDLVRLIFLAYSDDPIDVDHIEKTYENHPLFYNWFAWRDDEIVDYLSLLRKACDKKSKEYTLVFLYYRIEGYRKFLTPLIKYYNIDIDSIDIRSEYDVDTDINLLEYYKHYLAQCQIIQNLQNMATFVKSKQRFRRPNFPDLVSETLVLRVLTYVYQTLNITGDCVGDLCWQYGKRSEKIEIKGFSSDGPISFGPTERWDVIYFIDFRETNKYILYEGDFTFESDIWQSINITSSETFSQKAKSGQRPRLKFDSIKSQITNKLNILHAGKITNALSWNFSNKIRIGDFFCGVGGFHTGFKNADPNIKCVIANDINEQACETYLLNHPDTDFELCPIGELKSIPEMDVFCGGFPCQSFSIAGKQKGFDDSRGQVFFDIIRILKNKRPPCIFLENVKNLTTHDEGNTFKVIRESLESLGYYLHTSILNGTTHGNIPQNRERIFIVGFLDKSNYNKFEFPESIPLTRKVVDLLSKDVPDKYYYTDKSKIYETLKQNVTDSDVVYQYRRTSVRDNKSGVCPTLTANMGSGGHNVPIIYQSGIRKLTPMECFALQGFPADFKLPNIADNHLYKQAGNSVVVTVISRIAEKILIALND